MSLGDAEPSAAATPPSAADEILHTDELVKAYRGRRVVGWSSRMNVWTQIDRCAARKLRTR